MAEINRLADSSSPYLLAHADNPVAWQPWDAAALEAARASDRPILISIGYSACHWCHVMARETFADPEIAALMNRHLVNIKVDREERPDLDRVYQLAYQALMGRGGGWPLTVFLTPDEQMPFFAGTYFPPRPAHGLPGFDEVIEQVARAWHEQRDAIRRQNAELARVFAQLEAVPQPLDPGPVERAGEALEQAYDPDHGGFGDPPKFPHPGPLALALERAPREPRCRTIAEHTLARMATGGIFDQIGGGFARYATEAAWQIPHFEKMLYDNGALLGLYADAAITFDRGDFAATARATADWLLTDMRLPEGAFCASLDADSEGEEGRYYVWSRSAIQAAIGDDPLAWAHFGFDGDANFGSNYHPVVARDRRALADAFGLDSDTVAARIERARQRLAAARAERVPPARDDKVLTAWNALAVEGLAVAGWRLDEPGYVDAAQQALDFIRAQLDDGERLYAVWRQGRRHQPAFADDYAALLNAVVASLRARWRDTDLELGRRLADTLVGQFQDERAGGFFQTGSDHEALPYRPKPAADESVPSTNGLAALGLDVLGHLVAEPRYLDAARSAIAAAMTAIERDPLAHATLVRALARQFEPVEIVRVTGEPSRTAALTRRAGERYRPGCYVFVVPRDSQWAVDTGGADLAAQYCRGQSCQTIDTDPARIEALINAV